MKYEIKILCDIQFVVSYLSQITVFECVDDNKQYFDDKNYEKENRISVNLTFESSFAKKDFDLLFESKFYLKIYFSPNAIYY